MIEQLIKKDKYIIYNEEYKILVFEKLRGQTTRISLPSYNYDIVDESQDLIRNLLLQEDNMCRLTRTVSYPIIFQSENNKLRKKKLKLVKNYYSCYRKFTKEDYVMIMDICYKNNLIPHFVTIDELRYIINNSGTLLEDIYINRKISKSLDELDKRLKFIKY